LGLTTRQTGDLPAGIRRESVDERSADASALLGGSDASPIALGDTEPPVLRAERSGHTPVYHVTRWLGIDRLPCPALPNDARSLSWETLSKPVGTPERKRTIISAAIIPARTSLVVPQDILWDFNGITFIFMRL
jgi:hypothetical protein